MNILIKKERIELVNLIQDYNSATTRQLLW